MAKIITDAPKRILHTAREVLESQGIDGLNMRTISQSCGIALGTIYNYYPTKADLLVELMADYWDEFLLGVEETVREEKEIFTALHGIYDLQQRYISGFKNMWLVPALYDVPEGIQKGVRKEEGYLERLTGQIEKLLIKAQAAGEISLKKEATDTAKFILLNFTALSRQSTLSYEFFEQFLKALL